MKMFEQTKVAASRQREIKPSVRELDPLVAEKAK